MPDLASTRAMLAAPCIGLAAKCTNLALNYIFNIIVCFFPIFDMNTNFIIDCWSYNCVNREGWVEDMCKKCHWCEKCPEDLGFKRTCVRFKPKFPFVTINVRQGVSILRAFYHNFKCHYVLSLRIGVVTEKLPMLFILQFVFEDFLYTDLK